MPEPRSITDAATLIRRGELTPSELLEQCLARIDRYEPKVGAWVYLDRARARQEAEALTTELMAGQDRGPLHGIPIGIKDIIDVFDMPTGCGSKLWANSYARRDATCVERLRRAGALILGKTVTTAYASFDPPVTRNPWNLDRTPGGSSSGSAAAVACGMCLGALGTQTGGSVTRPASYCGVYSLKPTFGRISVEGVLPFAPSLDHVGVMANCVRDLAMMFQVTAGAGGRQGLSIHSHATVPDAVNALDLAMSSGGTPALQPLGGMFNEKLAPDARPAYAALLDRLAERIPDFSPAAFPAGCADLLKMHRVVMAVEAAQYHRERLSRLPDDYPPNIRALLEEGLRSPAIAYTSARSAAVDLEAQITRALNGQRFFVTPATTGPAPDTSTTGDPAFNSPWSFTGHPTVSVPYGSTSDGLPLAVQLVGSPMGEADLLAAGAWCERAIGFEARPLPL